MKSFEPAVRPVTATSAPGSLPTVAGTTCERRTASDRSEAASVPLPLTESATTATVLFGLISTADGSESCPLASAWSWSCAIAAWTGAAVTAAALMTGIACTAPPGEAAWGRAEGWMGGRAGQAAPEPGGLYFRPGAG